MGYLVNLAKIAAADRPASVLATQQARDIRDYLDRILGDHPDKPEALAIALRTPGAALESFRADEAEGLL